MADNDDGDDGDAVSAHSPSMHASHNRRRTDVVEGEGERESESV